MICFQSGVGIFKPTDYCLSASVSDASVHLCIYLSIYLFLTLSESQIREVKPGLQKDRDRRTAGPMEGLSSIGRFRLKGNLW